MANGRILPGRVAPTRIGEGKTYSEMLNEQLAFIQEQREKNLTQVIEQDQRNREFRQRQLENIYDFDISGLAPTHVKALSKLQEKMANSLNPNSEDAYQNSQQLIADIAFLNNAYAEASGWAQTYGPGNTNYSNLASGAVSAPVGVRSNASYEGLQRLNEAWLKGGFDGDISVGGSAGNRTLTGTSLTRNIDGDFIPGDEGVDFFNNPILNNPSAFWAPEMLPIADLHNEYALAAFNNASLKNPEMAAGYAELNFASLLPNTLDSYRKQLYEKMEGMDATFDQLAEIAQKNAEESGNDPKVELEKLYKKFGIDNESLKEDYIKAHIEGVTKRGFQESSYLSTENLVDGLPAFAEPMKLQITGAQGFSGDVVSIRPVGQATLGVGSNGQPIITGGIELVYEMETRDGVTENRTMTVTQEDNPDVYDRVLRQIARHATFDDLKRMWTASQGRVDVSNISTSSVDPEKKNNNVEDPQPAQTASTDPSTPATTASTQTTKAVTAVTPQDEAADEEAVADEPVVDDESEAESMRKEYDSMLRGGRQARFLEAITPKRRPYSSFIREIQNLPLELQKKLIQEKLNYETSNFVPGKSDPEYLKGLKDQLDRMGVEAETDEQMEAQYTDIQRQIVDINLQLESTPETIQGLNRQISNPEYRDLVKRKEELTRTMEKYENLFGVMERRGADAPSRVEPRPAQPIEAQRASADLVRSTPTELPMPLPFPETEVPEDQEALKIAVSPGDADKSPGRKGRIARRKAAKQVANLAASLGHPHPEVVAAQYAIETGWSPRVDVNNLFGMKVGPQTSEVLREAGIDFGTIVLPTTEEIKPSDQEKFLRDNPDAEVIGKKGKNTIYAIDANFYSFNDIEEGVEAYIVFTRFNMPSAYSEDVSNGLDYVKALQDEGYATASGYISSLNSVITGNLGISGGLESIKKRDI